MNRQKIRREMEGERAMKQQIKKQFLFNLPYLLLGLLATNLGEAWRMADGIGASQKLQNLLLNHTITTAFANPVPSVHPFDLVGWFRKWGCISICGVCEREEC